MREFNSFVIKSPGTWQVKNDLYSIQCDYVITFEYEYMPVIMENACYHEKICNYGKTCDSLLSRHSSPFCILLKQCKTRICFEIFHKNQVSAWMVGGAESSREGRRFCTVITCIGTRGWGNAADKKYHDNTRTT